jgi:alkanesulfonate monooxygenase SsuD/methylene tetrahydromethanopterin reductase-like flavin-dependent oxidoreductase (luciferase family)
VDHVSGGRAGWNVVTPDVAKNFNLADQPAHAERYDRAAEFLEVAYKLWDSWGGTPHSRTRRPASGATTTRVHPIDHVGRRFQVRGPVNLPRSPQAHPLIVQAGSSEDGKGLAARYAEAVFTAQQNAGGRAGVLRRPQAAHGLARPGSGGDQDPARHRPGDRLHVGGGIAAGA